METVKYLPLLASRTDCVCVCVCCVCRRWRSHRRQQHLPSLTASCQMTSDTSGKQFTPSAHPMRKRVSDLGSAHCSLTPEEMGGDDGLDLEQGEKGIAETDCGAEKSAEDDWREGNEHGSGSHVTGSVVLATGYTGNAVVDSTAAKGGSQSPSSKGAVERRQDHVPQDFESLVQRFRKRPSWQDGLVAAREKEGTSTGDDGYRGRKTSYTLQMAKEVALERGRASVGGVAAREGGTAVRVGGAAV